MRRIEDQRFLRWFCRFVNWPSRHLDGSPIVVTETSRATTITLSNGVCAILQFEWTRDGGATLLPGSRLLSLDSLSGLERTLTIHVERLLRRHGLMTHARPRKTA